MKSAMRQTRLVHPHPRYYSSTMKTILIPTLRCVIYRDKFVQVLCVCLPLHRVCWSFWQAGADITGGSSSHGSSDGINHRVVEGQTHDTLKQVSADSSLIPESWQDHNSGGAEQTPLSSGCLKLGSRFKFRITVLQASHVPSDYADIFCQFK